MVAFSHLARYSRRLPVHTSITQPMDEVLNNTIKGIKGFMGCGTTQETVMLID